MKILSVNNQLTQVMETFGEIHTYQGEEKFEMGPKETHFDCVV